MADAEPAPVCGCHNAPMLFRKDSRYRRGGFYYCRIKNLQRCRASYEKNRETRLAKKRQRYDTDPIHRIEKRLADDRRSRQKTVKRRRERLGSLPQ